MEDKPKQEHKKPPFFKSWKGMYIFVLAFLGLLILLFQIITTVYKK